MSPEDMIQFTSTPNYVRSATALGVALVLLALVITVLAMGNYGRGREGTGSGTSGAPWRLLIATMRDIFVLNLLAAAMNLLRDGYEVIRTAFHGPETLRLAMPLVDIYGSILLRFLFIYIAVVRVIELGRWLRGDEGDG